MRTSACSVLVAGGGPVGAVLTRLLRDRGIDVRAISGPSRNESQAPLRPVALAAPSHALIARLGLADGIDFTPISAVHVSQAAGFGRTRLDAAENQVPALGYVCDLARFARKLAERVESTPGAVLAWRRADDAMEVEVAGDDGVVETVRANLLVVADGGASGEQVALPRYDQSAIVASVRSAYPQRGIAFERFTAEGPLALLPYQDRYAIVWAMHSARAQALAAADDDAFLAALAKSFGTRLGRFLEAGPRFAYPLEAKRAAEPVAAGLVRIGNAAQTLHPVAGQGLNLGLRDAMVLAGAIGDAPADALATARFAEAFARSRRLDRALTIGATDFLARVFTFDAAPLALARGAGLALIDSIAPARRALARRMMLGSR